MPKRVIQGKRILVTGASSGIGRALVLEAAKRGAKILATARHEQRLAFVAAEARRIGAEVEIVPGDICNPETRQKTIDTILQRWAGLDILMNNAGIGATGHFQYAAPDRLRTIMEVNFFAPCELCRLAIPLLKRGNDPCIVMISSVVGRRAVPARSEYSASKFALIGFSEALRAELAKDDIDVTVVSPGLTATNFEENMLENAAKLSLHAKRSMTAETAARQIVKAVERRRHEVTLTFTGKLLVLINRLAPRFIDRKMARLVRRLYQHERQ
jgi:short-subunit dehydrogenase